VRKNPDKFRGSLFAEQHHLYRGFPEFRLQLKFPKGVRKIERRSQLNEKAVRSPTLKRNKEYEVLSNEIILANLGDAVRNGHLLDHLLDEVT